MSAHAAGNVAFVDDDPRVRAANAQTLSLAGFNVRACASAAELLRGLTASFDGAVVTDIRMPGMDGRQLFRRLKEIDSDLPVILVTGHGDIEQAVEAIRDGAYDFIAKPYPAERLVASVRRAIEKRALVMENRRLRAAAERAEYSSPLIGSSPVMSALRATVRHVAAAGVDVLLEGETGVGKEVVARALHAWGKRRGGSFIAVNCAAMPEAVIESELFGHEAGAFPGALRSRTGSIVAADGGTLFLDDIESLSPRLQARLLRVLGDREVVPLGSTQPRRLSFRVVAASKADLGALVRSEALRGDLFYHLNVVRIRIAPLRERRADVPMLFAHFLAVAARRFRREIPQISDPVRRHLLEHDWPGNVRELQHFAERVALGVQTGHECAEGEANGDLPARVRRFEASVLRETLAAAEGDVRAALSALGIPRKTLYDKLHRHGIDIGEFRGVDTKRTRAARPPRGEA